LWGCRVFVTLADASPGVAPDPRPPQLRWFLQRARDDPEGFWSEAARELHWFRPWERVFEWQYPAFHWFRGGQTNLAYNAVDHQVLGQQRGTRAALVWESAETGAMRVLTCNQLFYEVQRFSAALTALGVGRGDRVTIYMPMVPEAVIAMLATTRIGAIHSVVFGGFAAGALAERIRDTEPKVVLTCDVGYRRGKTFRLKEVVDEALAGNVQVGTVVVLNRAEPAPPMKPKRDITWEEALEQGRGVSAPAVPMEANELAFILHTSGTTAKPKGVVHTHGGYQVYIHAMGRWVFGMQPDDMWWCTSDIGWIVGHSYQVYAPLLLGCTTLMYEGVPDHPTPEIWWQLIERHRVTRMFTSPTAVRALMRYGDAPPRRYDLSTVQCVVSAGEVLNPAAWQWLQRTVLGDRVPVIDHMWQTESGGPMVGNPYGLAMLPIKPGSATIPLPGIEAEVVDRDGTPLPPGAKGTFVCTRPFPGLTPSIWRDPERYVREYWERLPGHRYYYTGDAAIRDAEGYIWFVGRADEVIKIAAHRIGPIEIESALVSHPAVAEAATVGKPDPIRGEVAAAFVTLKAGVQPGPYLQQELREQVRKHLGAVVVLEEIRFVSALPKTRSGKILRRLIRALIAGQDLGDYSTIEDEASIDEIRAAAQALQQELGSARRT
jgi:acetyl-CoA synthetase